MIRKNISKSALLVLLLYILYSCTYDGPTEVYNANESGSAKPEITSIDPSDLALAQYSQIRITGKNFASGADSNFKNIVYFNNKKGTIISESETEIVVLPPNISGQDITIKISVPGAFDFAEYNNYRVELLSKKSEAFLSIEKVLNIAVDANENLYAGIKSGNSTIFYKVEPGKDKYEFGSVKLPAVADMKIGPNSELYFQPGTKDLYKISSNGGEAFVYAKLPKNVKYFDFDQNKNIYSGGSKTGIFRVDLDTNITEVGSFAEFDFKSLRVFEDYIYFSANYTGNTEGIPKTGIWKSKISESDGNLGKAELVFDWANSGNFATSKIGTLALTTDGTLFIGCDNGENPIVVVHPNGSSDALYSGLLFTKTVQFVWGNSNTLYHNLVNGDGEITGVYKIYITDWESTPYYGRL